MQLNYKVKTPGMKEKPPRNSEISCLITRQGSFQRHCHKFDDIDDLDISASVPEVAHAEGAGGDDVIHALGHVLKPFSGKFKGDVGIADPDSTSAAAAAGVFPDVFHFF